MPSFVMCHRYTGQVIQGYRVTSATEEEIARANHRMREVGTPFRFVIDLHPPKAVLEAEAAAACATDAEPTTLGL